MKIIKIKFVDFWDSFDILNNDFLDILKKKYQVELSDTPDYIFYSCFGYEHLKYHCVRIFFTGECLCPNFNICDYAMGFESMDFGDRYMRLPLYLMFHYYDEFLMAQNKHLLSQKELQEKEGFCNFVYSNCMANDERTKFFYMLSEYKRVDSGGRYLNNIGGPVKDKLAFQKKYRFSIAFENCVHVGYTTEKIMEAFAAGTIPIYYGNPDIAQEFNAGSFINCHDFRDFNEVVEWVKEIDNDESLFNKIIGTPINGVDRRKELEQFLYHIFDQDPHRAFRRGDGIQQKKEEAHMKRYGRMDRLIYYPMERVGHVVTKLKKGVKIR